MDKFNSLTPKILNEIKPVYKEALDYAFDNKDIKNIVITGIYGAGKSTIWRSYATITNKENIITVSLGKYVDILNDEFKETLNQIKLARKKKLIE